LGEKMFLFINLNILLYLLIILSHIGFNNIDVSYFLPFQYEKYIHSIL